MHFYKKAKYAGFNLHPTTYFIYEHVERNYIKFGLWKLKKNWSDDDRTVFVLWFYPSTRRNIT
jgi:hypothetical protein